MKIEKNQIQWIDFGERAAPRVINRPVDQLRVKVNENLDKMNKAKQDRLVQINETSADIGQNSLGLYLIRNSDISVEPGLPVGFKVNVVSSTDITIDFGSEKLLDGSSSLQVQNKSVQLVKITEDTWIQE